LKVKDNYQIYPVDSRGINFVGLELILLEMVKLIMLIVEIKFYFILYIDLIIFLLILKLLNMIGVFILKVKKKKLNLKHNIL